MIRTACDADVSLAFIRVFVLNQECVHCLEKARARSCTDTCGAARRRFERRSLSRTD